MKAEKSEHYASAQHMDAPFITPRGWSAFVAALLTASDTIDRRRAERLADQGEQQPLRMERYQPEAGSETPGGLDRAA